MFDEISIGNILKNVRKEVRGEEGKVKFSQKQVGNELALADTTISAYETEKIHPDFKTILKYLNLCGYELKMYNIATGKEVSLKEYSKEL